MRIFQILRQSITESKIPWLKSTKEPPDINPQILDTIIQNNADDSHLMHPPWQIKYIPYGVDGGPSLDSWKRNIESTIDKYDLDINLDESTYDPNYNILTLVYDGEKYRMVIDMSHDDDVNEVVYRISIFDKQTQQWVSRWNPQSKNVSESKVPRGDVNPHILNSLTEITDVNQMNSYRDHYAPAAMHRARLKIPGSGAVDEFFSVLDDMIEKYDLDLDLEESAKLGLLDVFNDIELPYYDLYLVYNNPQSLLRITLEIENINRGTYLVYTVYVYNKTQGKWLV